MLQSIRNQAKSWVVFILFGLLILSFGIWGIADIFRPGVSSKTTVASVGDIDISAQAYMNDLRRELSQIQRAQGMTIDLNQARQFGIASRVLRQMVNDALLTQGANDLGIGMSTATIAESIRTDRTFQNQTGRFDKSIYERILADSGLTEARYVALKRSDMAQGQLTGAVTALDRPPEFLVDKIYRYVAEKRVAELLQIADASMPEPADPDATALADFHKDNAKRFTAPEYRQVTAIIIRPEDIAPSIGIDDKALKEAYEERKADFETPEKRTIEQLLFTDQAKADTAYDDLKRGYTFERVAKEVAGSESAILKLGTLTKKEVALPALADAAFKLGKGEISAPIKSDLGWHLVRVTDIEPGKSPTFDEVRDKLKATLQKERAVDAMVDLERKIEDQIGRGSTLDETATKLGLKVTKIAAVDNRGNDPVGKKVEGLPAGPEFLRQVFEQNVKEDGLVTETQAGTLFVLRVDAITPSALRPLDGIKAEVTAAWKADQRHKAAEKKAAEIVAAVNGGKKLADIATEMKLKVTDTPALLRSGAEKEKDVPGALLPKLFTTKLGQAVSGPTSDGYIVAAVKEIKPADPKTDAEGVKSVREQVAQLMQSDLLAGLGAALRERHPVTIDEDTFNRLLSPQQ
ncbi:MAG TPA: SurA N-terminal domain-containing protein [Alphaproteobacteria bacterium]|jgi:peptidyl-prolyl cis-trans isomerase D|nr:SurA N-terminal domain-containing protein [Alphaproteobacteria bacterium]